MVFGVHFIASPKLRQKKVNVRNNHEHPVEKDGERKKESTKRHVYIEPGTQIDIAKNLKEQHKTERAEDKTTSNKQLFWTRAATVMIFLYTGFAAWQVKISHDTFNAANRPYVGVSGISIKHLKKDNTGALQGVDKPDKDTHWLNIGVEIKNFGPVPGTNYKSDWEVFIAGVPGRGVGAVDEVPTTIFPGESLFKDAQIGETDYPAVMDGTKSLMLNLSIEYDGPAGHYKQCSKQDFLPMINGFLDRGPDCGPLNSARGRKGPN